MSAFNSPFITRRNFFRDATVASAGVAFAANIRPVFPNVAEAQGNVRGWYRNIYRQLHLDSHLEPFKNIFRNFDAEVAAQTFKEAGFQMVSFMATDGPCYYPTKIGERHPGLDRDFVGEMTRALKKRGIRTIVYVAGESGNHERDLNETVLPLYKEILEWYDIDGFFIDGIHKKFLNSKHPLSCEYCQKLFDKEIGGKIPQEDSDPMAFTYRKWMNRRMDKYLEKIYRELSAIKPEIAILNNSQWMMSRYPVTPPEYVMHVEWDLPVPIVGFYSYNFSCESRYLSTLVDVRPNLTWSLMAIDGYSWNDYTMREPEAFMHESAILLAACGRTYLSDNPYPSGNPDKALMDAYTAVNKRTVELEPYLKNCKPVKDVAVLHSADSVWSKAPILPTFSWNPSPAYQSACGAHKVLTEGHVQMGIVNSEVFLKTIEQYNAVILPDQRILSSEESAAIRNYVKNGGFLIATGETGLRDSSNNRQLDNFSIADVLGVDYLGASDSTNSYIRITENIEKFRLPAYDLHVVGNYVRVKTTTANTLMELVPPYENLKYQTTERRWAPPPAEDTDGPGITLNSYGKGKAVYCASRVFESYYIENTPNLRKLGLWLLDLVYPDESRNIFLENTPINVELFFNELGKERFVHLINFTANKRDIGTPSVQDFITVHGIRVKVRLKNRPAGITSVPGGKNIVFSYRNGWASFDAEPLSIHNVYRIEV